MRRFFYLFLISIITQSCSPTETIDESGFREIHETTFGMWHGEGKRYYPTGELYGTGNWEYNSKEGVFKEYYKNGNLLAETTYVNDRESGVKRTYFDNGQLKSVVELVNGRVEGKSTLYDSLGRKIKEQLIENDTLKSNLTFHANGIPKVETYYFEKLRTEYTKYESGELQRYRLISNDTLIYEKRLDENGNESGSILPLKFSFDEDLCIKLRHSIIKSDVLGVKVYLTGKIDGELMNDSGTKTYSAKSNELCIPQTDIDSNIVVGFLCELIYTTNEEEGGCMPFAYDIKNQELLAWKDYE